MRAQTTVAVGPAAFRIGSDFPAIIAAIKRLYAAYPKPAPDRVPDFTVRLEASAWWRRWVRQSVRIDGDFTIPDALPLPASMGLLAAEMGMNLQMALGWGRHMLIHASSVARNTGAGAGAILMPGQSGSGKSTLAAILGHGDWRFMGDEFALLDVRDPDAGALFPFPRPVSLKNAAIAEMAQRVSSDRLGPLLTGTPKGDIRHVMPPAEAIATQHVPAPIRLILFPAFGGAPTVRQIPPAECFMRLTESSTNYVRLGEVAFVAVTQVVRCVPAFAVSYPDSATGLAMVSELWHSVTGPSA